MKRVYNMSFAEFQIRLFAWKRLEDRAWEKVRTVSWYAMIGSHQDPKKLPKSMHHFMKLQSDERAKPKVSDEMKQRFLEATQEYLKQVN